MVKIVPEHLVSVAEDAMKRAYCPYSGYNVGAALLSSDGKVFAGCNVENASYGLTVCAERTAFASAVAMGKKRFAGMAVVAGKRRRSGDGLPYPCGACLQTMAEFCNDEFEVFLAVSGETGDYKKFSFVELLPMRFTGYSGAKRRKIAPRKRV